MKTTGEHVNVTSLRDDPLQGRRTLADAAKDGRTVPACSPAIHGGAR